METTSTFRRSVSVDLGIKASPERLWALLTNAADIPRWNSTVSSIEGTVAPGARLKIKVPISPRTFAVQVDTFEPGRRLVWSDGNAVFRGVRTYALTPQAGGLTLFHMEEVFTGFMLPLIARSLPDFKPVFERYAADLKREAERA
ncbi:MAG: SRPBCC domain-containing protein [Planctomycetota bacterium]